MAKTEVRTELRLDDLASAALAKIQKGVTSLDSSLTGATRHMIDFAKQTAAVAVGVNLGNIFGSVKQIATGAFAEAVKADDQMRSLTRTMAGLSAVRGRDMLGFRRDAETVREKLTAISRSAHVAREDLVQAFAQAGANTKRTSGQLTDLIGNAAKASRALGVPVQEVVQGFMEVEKNVVSANNPIIAMVKQANLMRGHNEQIARRFEFMSKWAKERLAQKALAAMAEKAKEIPLTFAEMSHELSEMKMDLLRIIGAPMMKVLHPLFETFTHFITDNRAAIESYARTMGVTAKEWILGAADAAKTGFQYLQTHAQEIKDAIREAFDHAKSIFEWMLEHKGLIATGLVGAKVAPAAMAGGQTAVAFGKALGELARGGIPALGIASSAAAAGLTGMVATLGVFSLAVGAVGVALWQFQKLMSEPSAAKQNLDAQTDALAEYAADFRQWDAKTEAAFKLMGDKMVLNAAKIGEDAGAVRMSITRAMKEHEALVRSTGGMQEAAKVVAGVSTGDMAGLSGEEFNKQQDVLDQGASMFSQGMLRAAGQGNKAAIEAGITILKGSANLQAALKSAGTLSAQELEGLAKLLEEKVPEVAKALRESAGFAAEAEKTGEKGAVPLNVFNGGQTFQIKQDFRDQDPDRISFIFQRDLAKAAENRLQARTSLPFGG